MIQSRSVNTYEITKDIKLQILIDKWHVYELISDTPVVSWNRPEI